MKILVRVIPSSCTGSGFGQIVATVVNYRSAVGKD